MPPPSVYEADLATVRIDPRSGPLRAPRKPAFARAPNYERDLDRDTLFFDIFREPAGDTALAQGPPMPRHLDPARDIAIRCAETGRPCAFDHLPAAGVHHGDWLRIHLHPETRGLVIAFAGQQVVRAVEPNVSSLLAGRRVLISRGKDDDLAWIADRVWFHAFHYGFDAVVHYDNASRSYGRADVAAALRQVPGLETIVTLDWPFGMWPAGVAGWPEYDEVWGDNTIVNHAHRRLLMHAGPVLWGDSDELLIRRGARSFDDLVADPEPAALLFTSQDVVLIGSPLDGPGNHRDLHWTEGESRLDRRKWLAWPARSPGDGDRWMMHDPTFHAGTVRTVPPDEFHLAHFMPLTTGWLHRADRRRPISPIPGLHREDHDLQRQMDAAYSVWHSDARAWTPGDPDGGDPLALAAIGWRAVDAGDDPAAIAAFERSLALDPHQPLIAAWRLRLASAYEEPSPMPEPTDADAPLIAAAAWLDALDHAGIPASPPVAPVETLPAPADPELPWLMLHVLGGMAAPPRHVLQFGLTSASTMLTSDPSLIAARACLTVIDHDPARMRALLASPNSNWGNPRFAPGVAALVLRTIDGIPSPVHCPEEVVPACPWLADFILVDGPPDALGGRAGMLAQALVFSQPGTLIAFGGLSPEDRDAIARFVAAHPDLARIIDGSGKRDARCVLVALAPLDPAALALP